MTGLQSNSLSFRPIENEPNMDHVVPPSLLFDFRLPVLSCDGPSKKASGRLLNLPDDCSLFIPSAMNEQPSFASIKAGWNADGFGITVTVAGKTKPTAGSAHDTKHSDAILLWIDTRPAGNVHRATEYCHHFACLPVDEESDEGPAVVVMPIAQQRAQRIESNPKKMVCRTHKKKDGYEFEVWIPASQLYGFRDVSELGRIGFSCVVQDSELGDQPLSIGEDFPTAYDPSTWLQLELLT